MPLNTEGSQEKGCEYFCKVIVKTAAAGIKYPFFWFIRKVLLLSVKVNLK